MDPRYPIGKPDLNDQRPLPEAIEEIAALPAQLREALAKVGPNRLDTPYREGGWTARQVVHHFADSHINSYVRFRLALTEDCPTIKPYDEKEWAELPDAKSGPVEVSLSLIDGLHARWAALLRSMAPADFERQFRHPERGLLTLAQNVRLYAWHCRHHLAHLRIIAEG
jgi:hypothetical protein